MKLFNQWKQQADRLYREVYIPHLGDTEPHRHCLFKAMSVMLSAPVAEGANPMFQAGTARWRMQPDEVEGNTHFAYKFIKSEAIALLARGFFPEMHCWVYDKASNWIIDMSAPDQPKQAESIIGCQWSPKLLPLPTFEIVQVDSTPQDRFAYQADGFAMQVAFDLIRQFHSEIGISVPNIRREYAKVPA